MIITFIVVGYLVVAFIIGSFTIGRGNARDVVESKLDVNRKLDAGYDAVPYGYDDGYGRSMRRKPFTSDEIRAHAAWSWFWPTMTSPVSLPILAVLFCGFGIGRIVQSVAVKAVPELEQSYTELRASEMDAETQRLQRQILEGGDD